MLKIPRGVFVEMKQYFLPTIISIILIGTTGTVGQVDQTFELLTNTTIIVDNEGDGDYLNIQAAINNAIEGDSIHVYSGTYQEQIEISTPNLQIIGFNTELGSGNDSDYPIINGNAIGNVISINADKTILKHCIFTNSGSNIFDAGIALFSDKNTIEENGITGNRYGITISNCSYNMINGNFIVANSMDGIFLVNTSNNLIYNNQIKENTFQGIFLYEANENDIKQNTIFLNEKDGIHLRNYCQYNTISENTIHSNNIDGIKIMESVVENNKITKNTIYSNGWNGIHVMDGTNNEFSENKVTLNHYNGFHFGETNNNLIIRNTIQDNKEEGIVFLFPSAQGNKIYYNNIINDNAYDNGQNIWDNGGSGGNYWSYYTGDDQDNNGIGETSYTIPGNGNIDRYPLINQQYPPETPTRPSGSIIGFIDTVYTYSTSSTDSSYNSIQYGWDWNGDDQVDEWTSFFNPDDPCSIEHKWSEKGSYDIKVKALDNFGFQSDWSDPLTISMPKHRQNQQSTLLEFIENYMPFEYTLIIKICNHFNNQHHNQKDIQ